MSRFTIRLAEKNIEINSMHDYIYEYCRGYIEKVNVNEPDISVSITQTDIDFEREKSEAEDIYEGIEVRHFKDDYLETLAVYRQIVDALVEEQTILFHGSVIAVDGKGYLFSAKSGTGKSTHTRLWRQYFGDRAVMVNDDKPLLKVIGDQVYAYGTPWNGKHRISNNIRVPLAGICFLKRGADNVITVEDKNAGLNKLVESAYRSSNPLKLLETLDIIGDIIDRVPLYKLQCNMDISAARVAYEGMNKIER